MPVLFLVMFDFDVARWVQNLDGYSMFLIALPFIIETLKLLGTNCILKNIKNGTNGTLNLEGEQ